MQQDPMFCLQECIKRQVEKEDMIAWAQAESTPFLSILPAVPMTLSPAAAYVFGRAMYKRSMSILIA